VSVDAPAAILFTGDAEGAARGVVLSHRNIVANSRQASDVLNTQLDDVMMCCLPPSYFFGLTVGMMMPLIEGMPLICHPDPGDTLAVARAIARYQATIFPVTPSLLSQYADDETVHPLMMKSLRVVLSGADGLTDQLRSEFENRFGVALYEGYGAAETTAVVSANIPDAMDISDWKVQVGNRPGSVGMPLPGTSGRVVNPDTLEELALGEDGLILISGNQVMLGYLNDEARSREAIVELDGRRWFRTGDRGHLTEDGFLVIVGRY